VWPPIDTWVAGGDKYDYSAKALQLVASGALPPRAVPSDQFETETPSSAWDMSPTQTKKGLLARLFGL
jgi:hypothetical protein